MNVRRLESLLLEKHVVKAGQELYTIKNGLIA